MRTNWAGNYVYRAEKLWQPENIGELQDIVAGAARLRVLGSRHSFNGIADSDVAQVSLARLARVVSVDAGARQVTIDGGMLYGDLVPELARQGYALANLASLPHISVAGAVSTATHGSGSETGNLATQVAALEVILADGSIRRFSRGAEGFDGAVVSLGALGVVTGLTLDLDVDYAVRQTVYTGLPFDVLAENFEDIFGAAKSVSVFTDWRGDAAGAVWVKALASEGLPPEAFFGAAPAERAMHPLPDGDGAVCTGQLGVPGPWYERLPHFRMAFTPSDGEEIQAEYFMPRAEAGRAIAALRGHGARLAKVLMISEIRTISGDDLWLSPGCRGDYFGFHFTFRRDWEAVRAVLPAIEADLAPLGAVPHWGKVSTMAPKMVWAGFPRLGDFRDLVRAFDPGGKFRNAFVDRMVFGRVPGS